MGAFDHLEWTYNGAFEQLFGLGRGEFEQRVSKNSNARGGLPGGMFMLRFDWYIRVTTLSRPEVKDGGFSLERRVFSFAGGRSSTVEITSFFGKRFVSNTSNNQYSMSL